MYSPINPLMQDAVIERVRGIILTDSQHLLMIKRIKPDRPYEPYWVAPGGGVETHDHSLHGALVRELYEELGARVTILHEGFVLHHVQKGKNLKEYFYVCRLIGYDVTLRTGPEFSDPSRGLYLPDEVPLQARTLAQVNFKTPELREWLIGNLQALKHL